MDGSLFEIVVVFLVGLVLQFSISRHRIAIAIATTIIPFAIMILTVGWWLWEHDALAIVGFVVAFVEYAAASLTSALVAWGVKRFATPGLPNVR